MERVTLGSASPRRLELLKKLNIDIDVKPPNIEEIMNEELSPEDNSIKVSLDKLNYIKNENKDDLWIITADTFISYKNIILGKPTNRENAFDMLKMLSGKEHKVITGVSIYSKKLNKTLSEADITTVKFKKLTDNEINFYLECEEWVDAAGAYQIQNRGEILIESINGSYSSVMGLPISRIYGMFESLNFLFR